MNRWDIINSFIEKHNYKRYLEIGYYKGWSFDRVNCDTKIAVDPNPSKTPEQERAKDGMHFLVTKKINTESTPLDLIKELIVKRKSDEFFEEGLGKFYGPFDIIFIDGLHEANQVTKDIYHALDHLEPGGIIVLHDCNPPEYRHTTTGINGCWTGDTYKAFVKFALQNPEYETYVVDTDWGCGIIHTPPRDGGNIGWIDTMSDEIQRLVEWEHFSSHREDLLNLISVEEFKTKLDERTEDSNSPA